MHYKVLVLGKNVEELLAPYDENLEVEPYVYKTMEEARAELVEYTAEEYTDEEVAKYFGAKLDEDGNLLTTSNPNSKWDWYSIGGRWGDEESDYGETVGETNWMRPAEHLEECKKFWKDYVEDNNLEPYTDPFLYRREYYKEKYKSLENYLKANTYKIGYALLTPDGEWHEPGQMGWFSSLGTLEDELDFEMNAYERYIKDLPPETPVTVVDCHI